MANCDECYKERIVRMLVQGSVQLEYFSLTAKSMEEQQMLWFFPTPPNTHHIPWAFTISLYVNSILLQTPATFHLSEFSQPTRGADMKCQGDNALESSPQTMTDESRRINMPVHCPQVGQLCNMFHAISQKVPAASSLRCPLRSPAQ